MSFRARLLSLSCVLAGLIALQVIGIAFSPDRVQARTSGQPLVPGASAQKIDGFDISTNGETKIRVRKAADGWETLSDARTYPASADRITTFLRTVAGLSRTTLVSSDAAHLSELGLSSDSARLLVLHRAGSKEAALFVGKRGPGGDADYVQVRGERAVFLARGSLAFFLAQEPAYWFELHVLPDDVQGSTISEITVRGQLRVDDSGAAPLRGGYSLKRPSAEKPDQWLIGDPGKPADRVTAGAMASSLAGLEGVDFVDLPPGAGPAGAEHLEIVVKTFPGKNYLLVVSRGPEPGKVRITTNWSPWIYLVNALLLPRAVLPESVLSASR
jgi:hypothetical protein